MLCDRYRMDYNLVSDMIGTKVENPIPKHNSNIELANEFANFFMDKIRKICNFLSEHPECIPVMRDLQRFNKFEPMTQDDMARIMKGMPTNICQSDTLLNVLLKKELTWLLPTITKLIKMSMDQEIFVDR